MNNCRQETEMNQHEQNINKKLIKKRSNKRIVTRN